MDLTPHSEIVLRQRVVRGELPGPVPLEVHVPEAVEHPEGQVAAHVEHEVAGGVAGLVGPPPDLLRAQPVQADAHLVGVLLEEGGGELHEAPAHRTLERVAGQLHGSLVVWGPPLAQARGNG